MGKFAAPARATERAGSRVSQTVMRGFAPGSLNRPSIEINEGYRSQTARVAEDETEPCEHCEIVRKTQLRTPAAWRNGDEHSPSRLGDTRAISGRRGLSPRLPAPGQLSASMPDPPHAQGGRARSKIRSPWALASHPHGSSRRTSGNCLLVRHCAKCAVSARGSSRSACSSEAKIFQHSKQKYGNSCTTMIETERPLLRVRVSACGDR
jgi:hypothetical protein